MLSCKYFNMGKKPKYPLLLTTTDWVPCQLYGCELLLVVWMILYRVKTLTKTRSKDVKRYKIKQLQYDVK